MINITEKQLLEITKILKLYGYKEEDIERLPNVTLLFLMKLYYSNQNK